jgi:hypothetical protein
MVRSEAFGTRVDTLGARSSGWGEARGCSFQVSEGNVNISVSEKNPPGGAAHDALLDGDNPLRGSVKGPLDALWRPPKLDHTRLELTARISGPQVAGVAYGL